MTPELKKKTDAKLKNYAELNKSVQKLAAKHYAKYIDVNEPLKDSEGRLKAEYTVEGMHINREGSCES